ncbi:MAG: PKD domain-containing protein [Ginsengibacter sp.]
MIRGFKITVIFVVSLVSTQPAFSQYILNGNATIESCNCYVLTQPLEFQGGSVWQKTKIDLRLPFDFSFNVYLGSIDQQGADGIAFILQPLSTSLGSTGNGMGFSGVSPSVGVLLDTWQNTEDNDPAFDHISIQANGVIGHHGADLSGPVPIPILATSDNIEDGQWHVLRIKWDPSTFILKTWVDGAERVSATKDLVKDIFNQDPFVYWGFSGATGGKVNLQKFCTALNPGFETNANSKNDAVCLGTPLLFKDESVSFTSIQSYYWDFGDGSVSSDANPPPHIYAQPGKYEVNHTITAADGCVSPPLKKTISIGDFPVVSLSVFDTCETKMPRIELDVVSKVATVDQWKWELDGLPFSTVQLPDFTTIAAGNHSLSLIATSYIGCASNAASDNFLIKNKPVIDFSVSGNCVNEKASFFALQSDNITTINKWQWNIGNQYYSNQPDTQFLFTIGGSYYVKLSAEASNGCTSLIERPVLINEANAYAGRDTVVLQGSLFQLNGSGGSSYSWLPSTGLSNPFIANPTGNVNDDIRYHLTVQTIEGCKDTASVKVIVFKGSAIYVPTAFTPNNDGLNDVISPYLIGIKSLSFFDIYDRWGRKIFSTNQMNKGWDGFVDGRVPDTGSYVWVLKAVDQIGKVYNLKGVFTLLK